MSIIKWINNRYGVNFDETSIQSVRDFSLIWNAFDSIVCDSNFSIAIFEQQLVGKEFKLADFEAYLVYFRNRYVENGATTKRFNSLHFRQNDREEFVRQVLLGQLNETNEVIIAITIIVYRFRNNLIHGLKELSLIDQQQENFDITKGFLMTLLNYF